MFPLFCASQEAGRFSPYEAEVLRLTEVAVASGR